MLLEISIYDLIKDTERSILRKQLRGIREIIEFEKKREDINVAGWNEDKQEGYIKAFRVILEKINTDK